ncbi:MAG: hypothetical protein ACE5GJ_09810 [Gemmatimonadota bacterium]
MSGGAENRKVILNDSEATLRQVEEILADFEGGSPRQGRDGSPDHSGTRLGLRELMAVLVRIHSEIVAVIDSLRHSRGLLEQAAVERLKSTHRRLAEVSSATEMATTGMLDGLDRALDLVDRLGEGAGSDESGDSLRGELKDELHQLVSLLQFQDITSQQLGYASGVLLDIEERMVRLARVFDMNELGFGDGEEISPLRAQPGEEVCDPGASTLNAKGRQAVADEIFTAPITE